MSSSEGTSSKFAMISLSLPLSSLALALWIAKATTPSLCAPVQKLRLFLKDEIVARETAFWAVVALLPRPGPS